jgi:malate/lactate dehydrogenase
MLRGLIPALSGTPLIFAGPSQAGLIHLAVRVLGLRGRGAVGSAPAAFASAVKSLVALEAGCSPQEVNLAVLGKPPHGLVIPWSDASIGGHRLEHRLDAPQLARIEGRIARLWPPGPYALGTAAADIAVAMLSASRRSYPVVAVLDGAFGVRHGVGVIASVLSTSGVVGTWTPSLTSREHVRVISALADGAVSPS